MQGNDYVRLASSLNDIDNVRGGLTMRSDSPTGTMMGITEGQVRD